MDRTSQGYKTISIKSVCANATISLLMIIFIFSLTTSFLYNTKQSPEIMITTSENSEKNTIASVHLNKADELDLEKFKKEQQAPIWYLDFDGDGFGNPNISIRTDFPPQNFSNNNLDCNDSNKYISPKMPEIPHSHVDEDCDGQIDEE